MNSFTKTSLALALGGTLLAGSVTASSARDWRPWAAAGAGFVAGAAIAGAAANANAGYGYYDRGYAYDGYAYDGYAYRSGPAYDSYATYESEPVYVAPRPYYRNSSRNYQDEGYGRRSDTLR